MANTATFAYKLASHSAPALLGVKPASLFSLSNGDYDFRREAQTFSQHAKQHGLQLRVICRCETRSLLLVFRTDLMDRLLEDPKRRAVLSCFGYDMAWDREACLMRLANRIANNATFPHETGIFLGYPLADVLGFIQNHGENYKLCGAWKVYDNPEQARHVFAVYDHCKTMLCQQLAQGQDLYQVLSRTLAGGGRAGLANGIPF